jgi:beta-lactamase superfamily II metal-dependent hydrolase
VSRPLLALILALLFPAASPQTQAAPTLDIYFIDVEGGQATLIVTPDGQSLLVDAGFPGTGTFRSTAGDPAVARDPQRIFDAATRAGLTRIDYLFVTHFHADHAGGVPELNQLIPIGAFIDHGGVTSDADNVAGTTAIHQAYAAVRAGKRHLEPRPGDRIPLTGVDLTVISSGGASLTTPLTGATPNANTACAPPGVPAEEKTENPRSNGFLLQFGRFRFLDVGDLAGAPLFDLSCPKDMLGPVDLYLVSHHGGDDASDPALFAAITPRVAVLNNGANKGGGPATFKTLRALTGTDTWQVHRSERPGAENFADERIANLDDSASHGLVVRAQADGSFSITNQRTGHTARYPVR